MYTRINPSVEWPNKELKAFDRVALNPGESKTVTLEIPVEDLRYWNEETDTWDYDPCNLEILVGTSSKDIQLKETVSLN